MHIAPDAEYNPDSRKQAKPITPAKEHVASEMQQGGCKYLRFPANNLVQRAMTAPTPPASRPPHTLPSPTIRTSNGRQQLLPFASRRRPQPPLTPPLLPSPHLHTSASANRTSVPVLYRRAHAQNHSHLSTRLSTHSIPPPSDENTHSNPRPLTVDAARVRSTQSPIPKPGKELPARTAVRLSLWMALIASIQVSSASSKLHFIQALLQNVGICLRLESSTMRSHVTLSGRNHLATTSDTAMPAQFWARHVRCLVGYPRRC